MDAYHEFLKGIHGDTVFLNAFKTLEELTRQLTGETNFVFDRKHLQRTFPLLHGTIRKTLVRLAGQQPKKEEHASLQPRFRSSMPERRQQIVFLPGEIASRGLIHDQSPRPMLAQLIVAGLVLFLFLATGLTNNALSAAPSKLIIGYAAMSARVVPLWIAEEQGILAKYGVDSEQVFIRGAPTLVAGLTSGDIHFGSTGGTATLAAIAAGHDLKMVAAFSSRNTYDLVTRPFIKRAEELRGKRFGVTSIGGTVWMGIMLWLEHFGLDEQRDKIQLQVIGDQSIQMQALEHGTIDAAVLDGVFSRRLKQKGFNITGEYSELKQLFTSQAIVVQGKFLQQRADVVENLLKAQIEAIAFSLAPKNKPTVIKTFMRRLRVDAAPRKKATAISIAPWTANLIHRPKDCATCNA